jgi:hypothetical protein
MWEHEKVHVLSWRQLEEEETRARNRSAALSSLLVGSLAPEISPELWSELRLAAFHRLLAAQPPPEPTRAYLQAIVEGVVPSGYRIRES